MYDELKTKCETFRAEIMAVLPELTENGCIKDVKAGALLQAINRAGNGVNSIINTIEAYYAEK